MTAPIPCPRPRGAGEVAIKKMRGHPAPRQHWHAALTIQVILSEALQLFRRSYLRHGWMPRTRHRSFGCGHHRRLRSHAQYWRAWLLQALPHPWARRGRVGPPVDHSCHKTNYPPKIAAPAIRGSPTSFLQVQSSVRHIPTPRPEGAPARPRRAAGRA